MDLVIIGPWAATNEGYQPPKCVHPYYAQGQSLGPAFLAAYLREHGHELFMMRTGMGMADQDVVEIVREARPAWLGVSITTRPYR